MLVFVGAKMAAADLYELPVWASLVVMVGVLGAAVGASMLRPALPPADPGRRRLAMSVLLLTSLALRACDRLPQPFLTLFALIGTLVLGLAFAMS